MVSLHLPTFLLNVFLFHIGRAPPSSNKTFTFHSQPLVLLHLLTFLLSSNMVFKFHSQPEDLLHLLTFLHPLLQQGQLQLPHPASDLTSPVDISSLLPPTRPLIFIASQMNYFSYPSHAFARFYSGCTSPIDVCSPHPSTRPSSFTVR